MIFIQMKMPKSFITLLLLYTFKFELINIVPFWVILLSWIRICILNADPDPSDKNICGSGSEKREKFYSMCKLYYIPVMTMTKIILMSLFSVIIITIRFIIQDWMGYYISVLRIQQILAILMPKNVIKFCKFNQIISKGLYLFEFF